MFITLASITVMFFFFFFFVFVVFVVVVFAITHVLSLLWQLKSFHRLIMRKVKVGLYCYLTAGIFTEPFYKCFLSSPPPSIKKSYKFLNLICCHGN